MKYEKIILKLEKFARIMDSKIENDKNSKLKLDINIKRILVFIESVLENKNLPENTISYAKYLKGVLSFFIEPIDFEKEDIELLEKTTKHDDWSSLINDLSKNNSKLLNNIEYIGAYHCYRGLILKKYLKDK